MKSAVLAASLSCAIAPLAAQAQEAVQLAPSAEWELGSGDESCWISRQFGDEDKGVSFRLESFGPHRNAYRIFMRGKALPQRDSGLLEFEYQFNPDSALNRTSGIMAKSGNISTLSYNSTLGTSEQIEAKDWTLSPTREAEIDELILKFSRGDPVALQLGSMADPLSRLRECTSELPAKWGLDAGQQSRLSRKPAPHPYELDPETFPRAYLRAGQSVMFYARLMVDALGVPTNCVVQAPRLERVASDIACQSVMQMRFDPALDASGEAVPSFYNTSIFFMTPRRNGDN